MCVDKTATPNCYDMLMNGAATADCIRSTKYGDVLPANMNLSGCSVELVGSEQREYIMKTALTAVQDDYDFILIDCPPSLELLTINALVAADSVLIPVQWLNTMRSRACPTSCAAQNVQQTPEPGADRAGYRHDHVRPAARSCPIRS